jgi:alpha-glucosidase
VEPSKQTPNESVGLSASFDFQLGMRRMWTGLLFWGISAFFSSALAENFHDGSLADGFALTIGNTHAEMRVASPHSFRLRFFSGDDNVAKPTIFLSGAKQPPTSFTITHEGSVVGLKTSFGELRIDADKKTWSLLDGSGAVLADWAPIGGGTPFLISTGPSAATPKPLFYGSGDLPNLGSLTQTVGPSQQQNGSSGLPQYWSNAGYGALMIGANQNEPASWKANAAGGVDWTVPGPTADLYLAPAATLDDWLLADAELTGFAPVPPRWSLGYLQSRWGWKDKAYIDDTLAHFRKDRLPVDAFIFDFEWYTTSPDYGVPADGNPTFADFDWNPLLLPQPAAQIDAFGKQGLHIIGIRKPRLGNTANLAMARSKGWILPENPNDPNGEGIRKRDFDFSNPEARKWWEKNNRKFLLAGMAGFWDDEGETNYTEYSYWNLAENELLEKVKPGARFWSINRALAPGLQRFGAETWSGDIDSSWKTLARTPGELLAYGLSGMPYAACDIGGFTGTPSPEMLARWMEAGVFFPIMRSHSSIDQPPHFPWLYGKDAEDAIRKALDLRYRLLPYYYSLAHANNRTARLLMRPLVMEFPHDPHVSNEADEWLMGSGLLAAPVLQPGGTRSIYLPTDTWFAFGSNQITQGPQTLNVIAKLDEIPLYVRAGTLMPLGPVVQDTEEISSAPLEMQIYPGRDASFDLVEDDGITRAYRKGIARVTHFSWDEKAKTLSWKVEGGYTGPGIFREIKAVLFSPRAQTKPPVALNDGGSVSFN